MTPESEPTLVSIDDIRAAAAGLAGIVVRTPAAALRAAPAGRTRWATRGRS